jgi:putative hydrolase of the HAD superfamily
VVFDLDDTLYPHAQFVHSGFGAVARYVQQEFGRRADEAYATLRLARDVGYRGQEFQRLCLLHGLDAAVLPTLVRIYRTHVPQLWLAHGALAALDNLRVQGWRVAVLTNGLPSVQQAKVRALGLEPLVHHVLYASEHAEGGKPAPAPFLAALARLEAAAHETVMVGDDPVNDVDGARAVGIRTIFVPRPRGPQCDRADAVVRLLTDVPRVASDLVGRGVAHAA